MKILSVKFLNLNSLKGENELRFDRPPFTESGLFAITGPTGAGKTTLLDAITVALYGRVHRHDKDVEEIMSRHTAECYSEVEFEVKETAYRAKWSLRRSRGKPDGVIQGEKMELAEVKSGKIIGGHTATLVKQAIVDLCGLDYNQFLRSVILSQGDFTRFLKANDNERSDLLEKITDTAIYSNISKFVFYRQKEEKEQLETLTSKLNDTIILSEEELKNHTSRLTELDEQLKVLKGQQGDVTIKLNWLLNTDRLRSNRQISVDELVDKQQQHIIRLPDFEKLKQHQQALSFKPQLVEIKIKQEQADKIASDLRLLDEQLPIYKQQFADAKERLGVATASADAIQKKIVASEPLFQKVSRMDADLENLTHSASKSKFTLEQAKISLNTLSDQDGQKQKAMVDLEDDLQKAEAWLAANILDKELDKQLVKLQQLHQNLNSLNTDIDKAMSEHSKYQNLEIVEKQKLTDNDKLIKQYQQEFDDSQELIVKLNKELADELKGSRLEVIEGEFNVLPTIISNYEQRYKLSVSLAKGQEDGKELNTLITNLKSNCDGKQEEVDLIEAEKVKAEKQLTDLRQLLEIEQRVKKYEEDRNGLLPEKPCPLCGSIHHPYVIDDYHPVLTETEQRRDRQTELVNNLGENVQQALIDINTLKVTLKNKESDRETLANTLNDIQKQFNSLNISSTQTFEVDQPEIIGAEILSKKQVFTELQSNLTQIRFVTKRLSDTQQSGGIASEKLTTLKGESGIIFEKIKTNNGHVIRLTGVISDLRAKTASLVTNISSLLNPLGINFEPEKFQEIENLVNERINNYAQKLKNIQQFKIDKAALKSELESIAGLVVLRSSEVTQYEQDFNLENDKYQSLKLERVNLFGDKVPTAEREKLQKEGRETHELKNSSQESFQKANQKVEVTVGQMEEFGKQQKSILGNLKLLNETLLINLNVAGILNIEKLNSLFLSADEVEAITNLQKTLEDRITVLNGLILSTDNELEIENNKNLTTETLEVLDGQKEALEVSISTLNQEIGKLTQIIEDDKKTKIKFAEITSQIELQQKNYSKWAKLSALIGSENGKKFSRFAQGLTLSHLADLANIHLLKLSDRYQILKSKLNDLELLIVDGYQADVVRPMASLSGGESFLVSLALALGLSDLASHKVQINSLFIDEGFGTLDTETLDVAISALENLQAKGKTIGIISHVEALKERISTQIRLSKQAGGISKIELKGYEVN